MNINKVLNEYDSMFGKCTTNQIEEFLEKMLCTATEEKDVSSTVTLLNEIIGFLRDKGNKEKGIYYCSQVISLMEELGLKDSFQFGTTLINVGNAYRAFGLYEQSEKSYREALRIYENELDREDIQFAALYNNFSLLYQEKQEYERAEELLRKALGIIVKYEGTEIEQATTYTNLATTLIRLGKTDEAVRELNKAQDIFIKDGGENYHYSGTLSAMGDAAFINKEYHKAEEYYLKAMEHIKRHMGETANYKLIEENLKLTRECLKNDKKNHIKLMDTCRDFYETVMKPEINEKFKEYENRIAVGLAGYGSECYGFEDEISYDHDCNVRLCLWVSKETYDEIGSSLEKVYNDLLEQYCISHNIEMNNPLNINKIGGVLIADEFFTTLLDMKHLPINDEEWYSVKEENLYAVCSGEVFTDIEGIVTSIRNNIKVYYSNRVWLLRIAREAHLFSQSAQYNYSRMMARGDYVTAKLCMAEGMRHAMALVYLLNKKYAPYYKWMRKGMKKLTVLPEVGDIMEAIADMEDMRNAWTGVTYSSNGVNGEDKIALTFDFIASLLADKMNEMGIINGNDNYLDHYVNFIIEKANSEDKPSLIDNIISIEWKQFDKVDNEGGRADCQDDFNTFNIMRKSQYLAFDDELLKSYYLDLKEAEAKGWNMITEKYGRMMESTAPREYEKIKDKLPYRNEERIKIQEAIIDIQVKWMEEFAAKYPKMAQNARSIHTSEDSLYNTSYETYLRGELYTYSDETLMLYGRFITSKLDNNENLAYIIMNNTAVLYGYKSVEDAENKLL